MTSEDGAPLFLLFASWLRLVSLFPTYATICFSDVSSSAGGFFGLGISFWITSIILRLSSFLNSSNFMSGCFGPLFLPLSFFGSVFWSSIESAFDFGLAFAFGYAFFDINHAETLSVR